MNQKAVYNIGTHSFIYSLKKYSVPIVLQALCFGQMMVETKKWLGTPGTMAALREFTY